MANAKADTVIMHVIVDVRKKIDVIESMMGVLEHDSDLSDNEEYFREDTLALGYTSEADRIVKEYIKKKGVPNTIESFKEAFKSMATKIDNQEFFGHCDINFIDIDESRVSAVFLVGGRINF